jgi:hypothetical protein
MEPERLLARTLFAEPIDCNGCSIPSEITEQRFLGKPTVQQTHTSVIANIRWPETISDSEFELLPAMVATAS